MKEKLPLREIKKARTKIKLFHAALDIIGEKSFREVYVEELCERVEISKVTFFKMFSRKEDILIYFMRLWLTDRMLELEETNKKGMTALRHIFEGVSEYAKEKPGLMLSLIAFLSEEKMHPCMPDLTDAEIHLLYPEKEEQVRKLIPNLDAVFTNCVEEGKAAGEITLKMDTSQIVKLLHSIFYGAYLTAHVFQTQNVMEMYDLHLNILNP